MWVSPRDYGREDTTAINICKTEIHVKVTYFSSAKASKRDKEYQETKGVGDEETR